MKLSRLYSNNDKVFAPINFNEGLNVILGKVEKEKLKSETNSTHNLGKTTLTHVIDFCLLSKANEVIKKIGKKQEFKDLAFCLEIKIQENSYITIRRAILKSSKISLSSCNKAVNSITSWDHDDIPFDKAKEILNEKLALNCLGEFKYRRGIGYCLRRQKNYDDVFQTRKGVPDKDWKPYMGKILGFNHKIISDKYLLEDEIKSMKDFISLSKTNIDHDSYDQIKSRIEIKETELKEMKKNSDNFDFSKADLGRIDEVVSEIEVEIGQLNNLIYNLQHKVSHINKSLGSALDFDIQPIKELFKDMGVYFKEQIINDYQSCIDFNRKMTVDRTSSLKSIKRDSEKQINDFRKKVKDLSKRKDSLTKSFRETDSFKKFKSVSELLYEKKTEIGDLRESLGKLSSVRKKEKEIKSVSNKLNNTIDKLKDELQKDNKIFQEIKSEFTRLCSKVFGDNFLLYARINSKNNIEFEVQHHKETSEQEGTSYKKLLCILFDLSVLYFYRNKSFFKFVYHDGLFEGFEKSKKDCLVDIIREYETKYKIQYILTALDSHVPNSKTSYTFNDREIVLTLHDRGSEGKLFKGPSF